MPLAEPEEAVAGRLTITVVPMVVRQPVIYLGRPVASVTVEAYRHVVDPFGIPPIAVPPWAFYALSVHVGMVLDLTERAHQESVGLTDSHLMSEVDDYEAPASGSLEPRTNSGCRHPRACRNWVRADMDCSRLGPDQGSVPHPSGTVRSPL